jgi:8-oxo-dGTP diphosphatase
LVEPLGTYHPRRVLSSPFVRCWQTVQPVAEAIGLGVESVEELSEGHGDEAVQLVRRMAGESAILCTHGDVATDLLAALGAGSGSDGKPIRRLQKGEFWVVQSTGSTLAIVDQVRPLPAEAVRPARDG